MHSGFLRCPLPYASKSGISGNHQQTERGIYAASASYLPESSSQSKRRRTFIAEAA